MAKQIKYQVGFVTDKTGLKELEEALNRIATINTNSGQGMNQNLKEAVQTAKQLSDILGKSYNKDLGTVNVTKFNKELAKSNIDVTTLQSSLSKAGAIGVNAYNKLGSTVLSTNVQLKQSNKLLDEMATSMANTVKWGISSSIFNIVTNSIQRAYDYSVNLNKSLNDIRIVTGKSADEMSRFAEQANNTAKNLGASTLDYTNAALIYYQQGLGAAESAVRAETTVKAANVTGQTGQEVSEQLTAVWNGYKVSAEETELYVDKLAAVAASTASDLEELSTGMSKVASAANSAGVDIDQLNAILSTVISVTREAPETIGSAFKTIFARLGDLALNGEDEYGVSLGKVSGQLHELGIEILDQKGEMRDMGDIIEDTAAKWQTWTRAQKQAAAVAMGGKMQYSRLIALFDSFDKYEDALNVSKNALGTLQEQNDIYLESTTAKLKTLKATWQDLYAGLINDDELNGGIEGLTNLVQVFDNFIDSFGGGLKSITAFGAIVANVFNKQIGSAIANAQINQKKYQQNVELLEKKRQFVQTGALQANPNSAIGLGEQANYETQISYAQKIQEVQKGITSEQYNQLTAIQQRIGQLEQEAVILEKEAELNTQKILGEKEFLATRQLMLNDATEINAQYGLQVEKQEQLVQETQACKNEVKGLIGDLAKGLIYQEDIEESQSNILNLTNKINGAAAQELKTLMQNADITELSELGRNKVLKLLDKIITEEKESLNITRQKADAINNEVVARERAANVRDQKNQLNIDFEDQFDNAFDATGIVNKISTITAALSTLTMSWSSLNMLIQTWNDDSASFGDKVAQTFITLGMLIPGVISAYQTLQSVTAAHNLAKAQEIALTETVNVLRLKDLSGLTQEQILEEANNVVKKQGVKISEEALAARLAEVGILPAAAAGTAADTAAKTADTAATGALTAAQNALNASMLANPITWVIVGLIATVAAIGAVVGAIDAHNKKVREQNDLAIEQANAKQAEIDANEKLYTSYLNMYDAYKNNMASKEDMEKVTDDLVEILGKEKVEVAKLTGNYAELTEEILKAQKAAAEKGLRTAETERESTGANMLAKAIEGKGHKTNWGEGDNNYGVWLSGWGGEEKQATDILRKNIDNSWITSTSGDSEIDVRFEYTKDNMVKFYDQMVEARKQMQEEMNATDLANSGVYQEVNDWIEKMKDDVEAYKNALADVAKYKTQIEAANINFRDVTDVEDLSKKRQQLIDYMKTLEEFKGKSDEEIEKVADTYIGGVSDSTNKLLTRLYAVNDLTEKFGEESRQKIIEALKDIPEDDLSYALQVDEQTSFDNLDSFIERAKLKAKENNIQTSIDNTNEIYDKLSSGKTLTKDEQEALTSLENEYKDLQQIRDKTSDDYLDKLRSIREALEDQLATVKALKTNDAIEDAQEKISNLMDDFYSIADGEVSKEEMEVTVNADTEAFTEAIDNVLDADYETVITVKADMDSDFNSAIDMMDEAEKMAGKIGESFIVDNENLRELNKSFPGILDGITDLHDGTSRLSQDAVAVAMANSKGIIATTTQEAVTRMKAEQQIVLGKAQAAEKIAMLANQMANSETMTEEQKAQTIGQIQDELGKFVTNVDEETNEIKTDNDAAVVDSANTNNQILTDNAAKAYSSMAQNSAEYADQAIANIEKVNAAAAGQEGGTGTYSAISSHYNGTGADTSGKDKLSKYEGGKNLDLNTDKGQWEQLAASAAAQAKTYREIYNDYTGMIAQLSSSVSGIDDVFKNAAAGKGGKSTASKNKSGGEKEKDPDKIDAIENEKDRYHDVNIELKQIETELGRIQKQKDKLLGQDLIDNLNKQLNLLNKQIDKTNEKISIAKDEVGELRSKLSIQGISFNNDGTIANYTQAYEAQLSYVNALVAKYNSMSAKEQEGFKETVEQAKKDFETFIDNMEKYDELISDTIPGLKDDIQDAVDKQIEIKIEEFTMEIKIRLDMSEAERDWNEFERKVIKGIKDTDILGNARARLRDFNSYYNSENTGEVQSLMKQVSNTQAQLEQMDKTGWSDFYGDNRAQALEDLKSYNDQLMKSMEDVEDLIEEIKKSYLDMMDEAADKFQDQVNMYEQVKDIIDHDMNIIKLVYGEDSYADLEKYYQMQEDNNNKQLDFLRQQKDFWYAQMQTLEQGSEEWEKAKENWMDAVSEWNSKVEEAVENIQDKYLNAINKIFDELNNKVTSGAGLDYVSDEWELINQNADQYLDTINSLYGIQSLENKYLDAIDQTDNLSAQKKLNDLMNEELDALREKDKLTQYDIDRANMKYEIALKQIALEEAQQNKSTMRLRRDSQGNYTYQYVADNDQIGQLQDELTTLKNELYNFDLEHYKDNLDQVLEIYQEFQEKMKEAAQINDPEERAAMELLLQEQYGELINGLVEQNETIRLNLHESAFTELADLYNTDLNNFQSLTSEEQEVLLGQMIPQWDSGIQHMSDTFAGEGGFIPTCKDAMEQLNAATETYEQDLNQVQQAAGQDFGDVQRGIDETKTKTEELIQDNGVLIQTYQDQLNEVRKVINELQSLRSQYDSVKIAAQQAAEAAYNYWRAVNGKAANAAGNNVSGGNSNSGNSSSNSRDSNTSSLSSGSGGAGSVGGDGATIGNQITYSGSYYYDSFGTKPSGSKYSGVADGVTIDIVNNNPYGIHIKSSDGRYPDLGWIKRNQVTRWNTGGYTGDWGDDSGRLAILDRKELILNKDDTANMLNILQLTRDFMNSMNNVLLSRMINSVNGAPNTGMGMVNEDTLEQNVHIDATFPNVKDAREVEEALNNLVNVASQRIGRNTKR